LLVVTVTETVPVPAGDTVLHEVVDGQSTGVAAFPDPKSTVVPPDAVEKPVPVRVTVVPPEAGPEVGEIEESVGAGM
jgi:hypothetical protein